MKFLNLYSPQLIFTLVYMLQATEYNVSKYFKWFWRTNDFTKVSRRKSVDYTSKAKLLIASATALHAVQLLGAIYLTNRGLVDDRIELLAMGAGLIIVIPVVTAHLLVVPLWLGTLFIQRPKEATATSAAREKFGSHKGKTIAVAGSYGKTTTKEVLKTMLGEKLKVAATAGNLNTTGALAEFGLSLTGDEDVVIVELGEFKPGDISEYASLVQPDIAVITGLTEAHLETLGDLEAAAENLLSLANHVPSDSLYINKDSPKLADFTHKLDHIAYGKDGGLGWKTSNIKTSLEGTSFEISKGKTKIKANSELLGEHIVSTLVLGVILAREIGVNKAMIKKGLSKTKPFDHRLQIARNDNITIIDDTYNGNIEGVKAAVAFVEGLEPKHSIYVSPGLVEMGDKSAELNAELGRTAAAVFDSVVLMKNPYTDDIVGGLQLAGFSGKLTIVDDPEEFYENINSFTTDGDVVLMQNDLPDVYVQT